MFYFSLSESKVCSGFYFTTFGSQLLWMSRLLSFFFLIKHREGRGGVERGLGIFLAKEVKWKGQ